jgi:hypothetical protein
MTCILENVNMFHRILECALYFDNPWLAWLSLFWSTASSKEKFGIIAYYCKKWACFNMCIRNEHIKKQIYNRLAFHMILDGRESEIIKYLDSYDNLLTAFHCMLHNADCTEDRLLQFVTNIAKYPEVCNEFHQTSLSSVISAYERNFKNLFESLFVHDLIDLSSANSAWILSHLHAADDVFIDIFLAAGPMFKPVVLKFCLSNLGVNDVVKVCSKLVSNPIRIEDTLISGPTEVSIDAQGRIIKPEADIWNIIVDENVEKDVIAHMTQSQTPHILARNLALLAPILPFDILENIGYWSIIDTPCIHQQVFWNKLHTFIHIQEQQQTISE